MTEQPIRSIPDEVDILIHAEVLRRLRDWPALTPAQRDTLAAIFGSRTGGRNAA